MNKIQKGECEMQLVNPLEQQNAVKTLYSEFVSPVCAKYFAVFSEQHPL